jgi:hypothetical protein
MDYVYILKTSASTISDRSDKYGTPDECFKAIAEVTGAILGREVTEYEVAAFQLGTKLGRARMNKEYPDNYVDGASYIGFLGHFAMKKSKEPPFSIPSNIEALRSKKKSSYSLAVDLDALADEITNPS